MEFKTIYADPPWEFNDKLDDSRKKPYMTLPVDELCRLPVWSICSDDSHLYLWCPATLIDEGIKVMREWGFDFKTIIIWLKRTANWKIWFGMGHYFRNCLEFCLFGVRGKLKTLTNNTRNLIEGKKPMRHHSAKLDEMYELIEKNSPGPYLEMFATIERENWTSWGFEIDQKDIRSHFKFFADNGIL